MFPSSILVNLLQKWGLFSSIFCDKKNLYLELIPKQVYH